LSVMGFVLFQMLQFFSGFVQIVIVFKNDPSGSPEFGRHLHGFYMI
jgi:hypothetical protein